LDSQWINEFDRNNAIYLDTINILDIDKKPRTDFISSEEVLVEMNIVVKEPHQHVKIGFDLIKNNEVAFRSQQVDTSSVTSFDKGTYSITCVIPKNMLNEGAYAVHPQFSIHCVKNLLTADENAVVFNVRLDTSISDYHAILHENNHPGIIYPALDWNVTKLI
jgi:hypothetical protein